MTMDELARLERESIRSFVGSHTFTGRTLDFGCGAQPYRELVEGDGAEYVPWDRMGLPGWTVLEDLGPNDPLAMSWDTILSCQVLQYVPDVPAMLAAFRGCFARKRPMGGTLVLTYPTTWPVIRDDLWHFTKLGMERLLREAGFKIDRHEQRAAILLDGFELPIGYGAVARA